MSAPPAALQQKPHPNISMQTAQPSPGISQNWEESEVPPKGTSGPAWRLPLGCTQAAAAPCPWRPRPRPRPSRCVWRSTSHVSPCTCSPAQLQAQFSFLFNPQINMCSYIFNREAVFIRVGISLTSFSPPFRRHLTLTRKTSRLMSERPGQVRETEHATPGPPSLLPGPCPPAVSPLPLSMANPAAHFSPPISPGGPRTGKLPGVLPDLLPTLFQPRASCLLEVREGRSLQPCLPEVIDFSFQLQVKAEQNKLSPFTA